MVKKNKTKIEVPMVMGPLSSYFLSYRPSVQGLLEMKLNVDEKHYELFIIEKTLVTLFMTRFGNGVLHLLYRLSGGSIKFTKYKRLLKLRLNIKGWKACYKDWGSRLDILSEFLDFCLQNDSCSLDYTEYAMVSRKIPLQFLLSEELRPAIVDEKYNLLLDYIFHSRPLWEALLIQGIPKLLPDLIDSYNRSFEFNGYYNWYGNVEGLDEKPVALTKDLYIKFFYMLFGKLTVTRDLLPKLNATVWSQSWPPAYTKHSNSDYSHDEEDYVELDMDLESDHWLQHKITSKKQVYTFELNKDGNIEFPNVFLHAKKRHETLYKILGLPDVESPLLKAQFMTICAFVDPITQPPPTDEHIISIDLIYQMFLGSLYDMINETCIEKNQDWKFHICQNMQKIILATMRRLNCHDGRLLNSVNNSDESVHWNVNLDRWTPRGFNTQDLELLYMVSMIAIYTIYKLYSHLPIQMNPYLPLSFHLWKNLTNVLLLGLEIDRLEEERETFNTPILVRATIRGSAALRSVVATMINEHFTVKEHDFKHEPINLYMSPHGRKICQGALYADVRSHAAAMLALGVELNDVTDLLSDLQPGDRFDADVRYMFDYEYDDYNAIDLEKLYDENQQDLERLEEIQQRERIKDMRGYYKRCHCVFDDDELLSDDDEMVDNNAGLNRSIKLVNPLKPNSMLSSGEGNPLQKFAVRSDSVEFDFNGVDWRDIPRGNNFYYLENYTFVNKLHSDLVYYLMKEATTKKLEPNQTSFLLRSIATCVRVEQEKTMVYNLVSDPKDDTLMENAGSSKVLTSDFIYEKWCENSLFEKMMYYNNNLVWRMMDEMLMCSGYRRVLIWFITHLKVSHSMIHYIYELVMGLRGNFSVEEKADSTEHFNLDILDSLPLGSNNFSVDVPFSRQGAIELSKIETDMLLQEFFVNAAIFFANKLRGPLSDDEEDLGNESNEGSDDGNSSSEIINPDDSVQSKETLKVSSRVVGLMRLVCFMVDILIKKNKFNFSDSEYIFELQTLLMDWIGIVPEACDLFFKLKSSIVEASSETGTRGIDDKLEPTDENRGANEQEGASESEDINQDGFETLEKPLSSNLSLYNKLLLALLPPRFENENSAITALRSFIRKHSLTEKTAVFGRRVIYQDHAIMKLYMSDKEMQQREFLAEFGIDFNVVAAKDEDNDESDAENDIDGDNCL
ncbi:HCL315Cp [Eremothecium sinecaudum]|uniref:HCL315Cp n=1 Tax=Eremothecium sinecaudum TaxID=45286 RepID=A0A109UWG7_9SACH|nr:HCL315Cp [Eremothecium sinecaudum]AMD19836.1 HCL315Cp [Eremothecium sinecaudum]